MAPDMMEQLPTDDIIPVLTEIREMIESPKDETARQLVPKLRMDKMQPEMGMNRYDKGSYIMEQTRKTLPTEEANLLDDESAKYRGS